MDTKEGNYYPVYMINDMYGGRGLNFRAYTNSITMFILGTFLDRKTQIQVLTRCGRYKDKCKRIRDTTFKEFDDATNAARKGAIEKFLISL